MMADNYIGQLGDTLAMLGVFELGGYEIATIIGDFMIAPTEVDFTDSLSEHDFVISPQELAFA